MMVREVDDEVSVVHGPVHEDGGRGRWREADGPGWLLARFALPMLVVFLLVGVALQAVLSAGARREALAAAEPAAVAAAELIYDTLNRSGAVEGVLGEDDWLSFNQVLPYQLSRDYYTGATLWQRDGTVLWSSQRDLVGEQRPDVVEELDDVLNGQQTRTWLAGSDDVAMAVPSGQRWIVVDVPVGRQGLAGPQLVMRIARDYRPVADELADTQRALRATLAAGLAGLFLLTLPIAWGAGGRLRRRARRLKDAEHRFRLLAEQSPAGLIRLIPRDGSPWEVGYINPAAQQMTATSASAWTDLEEVIAAHVPSSQRRASLWDTLRRASTAGSARLDVLWTATGGTPRWIALHATAVADPDRDGQTAVQLVMIDVTERAATRRALEDAVAREHDAAARLADLDETKTSFLRAISHEMRTPLTSILGSAVTLQRRRCDLSESLHEQLLDSLARNAQRLSTLLADLLDINQLTRSSTELPTTDADLSSLVTQVVDDLGTPGVDITVEAEQAITPVHEPSVRRIVQHLVRNAVRHANGAAAIRVAVNADAEAAEIVVADTGPGIPPDLGDTIFDPFVQGPAARDHHSPGTGIGLTLARHLTEVHGGSLHHEPNQPSGSRFIVRLPR